MNERERKVRQREWRVPKEIQTTDREERDESMIEDQPKQEKK